MADQTTGLTSFQAALPYGGARPSLFEFQVNAGTAGPADLTNMKLYCNVSALPPLTVTPIERQYFGRTVKIPGDMVFGDLSTTIIQTEAGKERADIEAWMALINSHVENEREYDGQMGSDWAEGQLTQYGKDAIPILTIKFIGLWPTTLAEIPLSYDTMSDIEQFDCTWAYNYYETVATSSDVVKGDQS